MAKQTRLYTMWCNIKARCYRKTSPDYSLYGERGIIMCDDWKNNSKAFIAWAENNGYKDSLTIERINPNEGYNQNNCKFITNEEQALNRRTRKDNALGHRGINKTTDGRYYKVRLTVDKVRVYVGNFKTLDEALKAKEEFMEKNKNNKICKEVLR